MDSHQSPPPRPHATTSTHGGAVENLKSLLMKCAIALTPAESLSRQRKTWIKKRIQEFIPTTIHTPDHPPYAWMIENAIKELNEEGGSDEEAISKFIMKEYTKLPWIHAALLNHHLKKLSKSGNITKSHDGCYVLGRQSFTKDRDFNPMLRITCATSPSSSPSPSASRTPSPSPFSSSSPTDASSDTSGSSQSFDLKRGTKKKMNSRKMSLRQKQNTKGMMRLHPKHKESKAGAGARGRGRGMGLEQEGKIRRDGTRYVDIICLLTEDDATDDENIIKKEEAHRYDVHLDSREPETMMMGIEVQEQEYKINDHSTSRTIPSSRGRKPTTEEESKRIRPRKRNVQSRCKPEIGMGWARRSFKRDMQMIEGETQWMDQEEGDCSMDELIEQVYVELTEPTRIACLTIDGEANLQWKELHEVEINQEVDSVNIEIRLTEMQQRESLSAKMVEKRKPLMIDKDTCIEEQNDQFRKLRQRPSRNESTNVADRSNSSTARLALRRRDQGSAS